MTAIALRRRPKITIKRPRPLTGFQENPVNWAIQHVKLLIAALLLAYVGMTIVAGVYYLVFQTWQPVTDAWHRAVPDDDLRHAIRNVYEGFLGGLLAQLAIWNHYKRSVYKPPNAFDRLEMSSGIPNVRDDKPLSWRQALAVPFLSMVYAMPGFITTFLVAVAIKRHPAEFQSLLSSLDSGVCTHAPAAVGRVWSWLWAQSLAVFPQNWDQKLMGYAAAFVFGRRPAKGVFDDIQYEFAVRYAHAKGADAAWWLRLMLWLFPTYHARLNEVSDSGQTGGRSHHGRPWTIAAWATIVIGIGLFIFGYHVLHSIAVQPR